MAARPASPEDLRAAVASVEKYGTEAEAARRLGWSRTTLRDRLDIAKRPPPPEPGMYPGRKILDLENGIVLVGGDAHYWPGPASTAHRAFVKFCKKLKPKIVVMNGDAVDMATVSRHPPLGWTHLPSVKDELEITQERLHEIEKAVPKETVLLWSCGNHDARLEVKIASNIPELKGVIGTSLADHFPAWVPCWSVFINDRPGGLVIKHRFKGGIHAAHNNAVGSGRSLASGHLHAQKVSPFSDYNGTRWGVDCGCLAEPWGEQFSYTEDNSRDWRSGFAVFTFVDGKLLPPELVHVIEPGIVVFRGEQIEV